MTGKRFSHFEMFKIALTTIYIASGFVIFGIFVSNASEEYNKNKKETIILQDDFYENKDNWCNCDEVD